jgi:uncharacterized protein (DUF3084 family)
MALSDADKGRLYSDAFAGNMKALAGENAFVIADLKTSLDVARYELGVVQEELKAMTEERDTLKGAAEQLTPAPHTEA